MNQKNPNRIFRTVTYIVYRDNGTKTITRRSGRTTTMKFQISINSKKSGR